MWVKDHPGIASLVKDFETVVVECHPKLINERCLSFRDMLKPELQVAMGLETANARVLDLLNKQMTTGDFRKSVQFLSSNQILSRAFILLKPPFLSEDEGIYWSERSMDFAFDAGVECCVVIPVRAGNGAMDHLMKEGSFSPPDLKSVEKVLEYGIGLNAGRVFADVWDIGTFSSCSDCTDRRKGRLTEMNLNQRIPDKVICSCNSF